MKPPRLLQVLPGAVATSILWLSAGGLFTVYIGSSPATGRPMASSEASWCPAFFDVTALIFFFGVVLNASLHSMVIIM